jgi:hypothetical protein
MPTSLSVSPSHLLNVRTPVCEIRALKTSTSIRGSGVTGRANGSDSGENSEGERGGGVGIGEIMKSDDATEAECEWRGAGGLMEEERECIGGVGRGDIVRNDATEGERECAGELDFDDDSSGTSIWVR